jgi:seryl-tRNA synthetase
MLDIRWIRENPAEFDTAMKKRGNNTRSVQVLAADEERRGGIADIEALQQRRNAVAKEIGKIKSQGGDADELIKEAEEIKKQIAGGGDEGQDKVMELLSTVPNVLLDEVPEGKDESDNVELRKVGEPRQFDFTPKDHVDVGEGLGMLDFEQTAKISGARFSTLKGDLAQLERALAAFMLDIHTNEFGYTEIAPPYMVKDPALFGTGQLPKFTEDLFKTEDDLWLIPTAEVVLANMVRESIVPVADLPIRLTACTPCFRSEAGSAGKDTRGMIRQHQFSKVELVSIVTPEQEVEEHERLTGAAEEVLKRLEIPYRVMLLCSGDTGFGAKKTYDIEAWLPAQNTYREISSCSMCGDFQARRMKARYKAAQGDNRFVHTLNGSGLAVGRTIVAILENYQNEDGSISIPEKLQPYMNGKKTIQK